MFRSNRGFFLAGVIGLAATCFGAGSWITSEWSYQPHRYPHYHEGPKEPDSGTLAVTIHQPVQPFEEKEPCENPRNRDQSDLCAQWRAAQAAEEAASWAWWQLITSVFGVFGLGVTLWFNVQAWKQADRSISLTERIGMAQTKAYISVINCEYVIHENQLFVQLTLKNTGLSPALRVKYKALGVIKMMTGGSKRFALEYTIAPDQSEMMFGIPIGAGADSRSPLLPTKAVLPKIVSSGIAIGITIVVAYRTVFEEDVSHVLHGSAFFKGDGRSPVRPPPNGWVALMSDFTEVAEGPITPDENDTLQ